MTGGSGSVALLLTSAALVLAPGPALISRSQTPERHGRKALAPSLRRSVMAAIGILALTNLFAPGPSWVWVVVGVAVGVVVARIPVRRTQRERDADRRMLAVHADLLAACLESGMAVGTALAAVSAEVGRGRATRDLPAKRVIDRDPLLILEEVAAHLALGADPRRAWQVCEQHPDLIDLAAAAQRSAAGGAGFAAAVREQAVALRATTAASAERVAGRAGVAMTGPLGLCFLPAFLCLGLAPVVVGMLGQLGIF